MNKASQYVIARVIENKAISLTALRPEIKINLHGSTVTASIPCTGYNKNLNQVIFYPEKDKDGIVAVAIKTWRRTAKGEMDWDYVYSGFIKITWKKKDGQDYPFADLDDAWVPADRYGQVTDYAVEVTLKNGMRFSNYVYADASVIKLKMDDGNVLCRYLWGTAHAADVLHAAVQVKLEPTAVKRVEQMANEICRLQNENRRVMDQAAGLYDQWKDEPLYKLLKLLPSRMRPKFLDGFVETMDSLKDNPAAA